MRSYRGISINTSRNTHEVVFTLLRVTREGHVVDVPSGAGAFVQRLLDHGYTNVTAMDIENILEIPHSQFVCGDMTGLFPMQSDSVDAVVCIDGIEHIHSQAAFVDEVARVLRRGGQFIVSTPNISSLLSRTKWLFTGHHHKCSSPLDEANPTPLHHVGMISFPELRYLMHSRGFAVETVKTNRVKGVSWLFAPLVPLAYVISAAAYRKAARREGTTKQNREILRTMFSVSVLFGETLILSIRKT